MCLGCRVTLIYLSGVTCRVEEGRWGIKCWTSWATISYISLQTVPGFPPLSVKRPRHYLAAAVLFFFIWKFNGLILRLHYVPGGHGDPVSDNREQNGITVRQRMGTG